MKKAEIHTLFPTILYKSYIEIPEIVLNNFRSEKFIRNDDAWNSRQDLHRKKIYKPLIQIIDKHVNNYCNDILKMSSDFNLSCNGAWMNLHKEGDFASPHHHSNSMVSGVLYLDVPKGSAPFVAQGNPYQTNMFGPFFRPNYTQYTHFNSEQMSFDVENGMLMLFPSTLIHSVPPNLSGDTGRYSFGFDYIPVGDLRTAENWIHIDIPMKKRLVDQWNSITASWNNLS